MILQYKNVTKGRGDVLSDPRIRIGAAHIQKKGGVGSHHAVKFSSYPRKPTQIRLAGTLVVIASVCNANVVGG
jgi:hypothetical protein